MYFCNFIISTGALIKFLVLELSFLGSLTNMILKQYACIVYSVKSLLFEILCLYHNIMGRMLFSRRILY